MDEPEPDRMTPAESLLLAAYRRDRQMPENVRARLQQRVLSISPINAEPDTDGIERPPSLGDPSLRMAWAATLAAAACLAVFTVSAIQSDVAKNTQRFALSVSSDLIPKTEQATPRVDVPAVGRRVSLTPPHSRDSELVAATNPAPPPTRSPDEIGAAIEAVQDGATPGPAPIHTPKHTPKPRPPAALSSTPEPSLESSALVDELKLLHAAQALVSAREYGHAQDRLDDHEHRFEDSELAEERRALQAIVSCNVGPDREPVARAFRQRYPQSSFRRRVEDECRRQQP